MEELTDYELDGEIRQCTDKLMRIYQKQFTKNNKEQVKPVEKVEVRNRSALSQQSIDVKVHVVP